MIIGVYLRILTALARIIDSSHACTRRHCYKVERSAIIICGKLDLSLKETKLIKIASVLHDIGKIGIDLNIVKKPAKLNAEEWAQVRMHPVIGTHIVRQVGYLSEIAPTIRHHHARYEGGGYPDPDLKGDNIPLGSRIISVVDAFDAMISDRPYRPAMSKEAALKELARCAGSQFDPRVVDAFLN